MATIPRTRKRISFGNAAMLLVVTAMVAQVLGFFRTKLVNANFSGINVPHDQNAGVYFAAFNLPDFFFFTIAAGALGVAFMPYLSDRLYKGDRKGVWELSNSLLNLLGIVMAVVGVLMFIFAEILVKTIVARGLDPAQQHNVAMMIRILSLNPLLFTISGVLTSVQQVFGRFFFFAIAPIFYNVSIVASIYLFKHNIGIVGLAVGALLGAVLQLIVVVIGLYGLGFHWRPKILWKTSDFRHMLAQLPPRSLDQGMDQIQGIVETNIASSRAVGGATAIADYNSAYVLHNAPVLLIGTAISTAMFPRLNARLSQGRPDLFRQDFLKVVRLMIWLTMPIIVVSFFARGYLARLIFSNNAPGIAAIFGFLTASIMFRVLYSIMSRWFYAQKDTKTPLFISVFIISLNVFLAYMLSRPASYGVEGLALAQSIVAGVEILIMSTIMIIRDPKLFDFKFWNGIFKIVAVTGFTLVAGFIAVQIWPLMALDKGMTIMLKLALIAGITIGTHLVVSRMFALDEAKPVFAWVKRAIFRPLKIEY